MQQAVAEGLDRDVLSDVLFEVLADQRGRRRRFWPVSLPSCQALQSLGECMYTWPLCMRFTPSRLVKLRFHPRTDPASLQEGLPVRPKETDRAALTAEAIAGHIACFESIEHPVGREANPLGDLACSKEAIVCHLRLAESMRSIAASDDGINSPG
ncbi:MAG: hypothetical protein ACRDNE_09515 [Gaiellaceae bacterium]